MFDGKLLIVIYAFIFGLVNPLDLTRWIKCKGYVREFIAQTEVKFNKIDY